MPVKTVFSLFYLLHRAVHVADDLQQHYEETGTCILGIFSRFYGSSILVSVVEQAASLSPTTCVNFFCDPMVEVMSRLLLTGFVASYCVLYVKCFIFV
jgi:hypothetical protein